MAYIHGRCLLKHRLAERNLKQADVVIRTGYSRSQISDYANNRVTMSIDALKTIASAVGCDMQELYEWVELSQCEKKGRH